MRVSREEMEKSHARIIESASWLFRERGIETTTVADVMTDAGLTHGGFYRHFDNKEALAIAALVDAFDEVVGRVDSRSGGTDPMAAVRKFRELYLSKQHMLDRGRGCPIAALGGDVARGSEEMRTAFGEGVTRLIAEMSKGEPGAGEQKRTQALRDLAMMAGAVIIARASDPETARRMLTACREKE